jgi:hypothetical protein
MKEWCGREDLNLHEIAPANTSSYSKFTVPPFSNGLRAIAACNRVPLWATVGTISSHRDTVRGSCLLWQLSFLSAVCLPPEVERAAA